jgi:hypothetical protein
MSDFHWVGRKVASNGTTADKILQYCFNDPRNWLVRGVTGSPALIATTLSPKNGDYVYFGNHLKDIIGWTSAKSPCLYGGYYNANGVTFGYANHLGSWAFTGTTASFAGNNAPFAWTINYLSYGYVGRLAKFSFKNDEYSTTISVPLLDDLTNGGYPFPYLGGGITGSIAEWCAARDGLTVGDYSIVNAGGIHNPANSLKLVMNDGSIYTEQLHRLTDSYTGNSVQENGLTKLIIDIENIPGYVNTFLNAPLTNTFTVYTHGTGVILRNMFATTVKLNYRVEPKYLPGNITATRDEVVDHGIKLINPLIENLLIMPQQKIHVVGGELARVLLEFSEAHSRLYGRSDQGYALVHNQVLYNPGYGAYSSPPYSPAPPIIFENGWNYQLLYTTLYGLTGAQVNALDGITWNYRGSISSSAEPVFNTYDFPGQYIDSAYITETNEGFYRYPFNDRYEEHEWRNFHHDIIVKPGVHSANPSPDTVQLTGWSEYPLNTNKSLFIRPRLLMSGIAGTTVGHFIPRIRLDNAVAAIDPVEPPESVTNISINMEHNSVVDFTTQPYFQKWFCGSMTGTGGFGVINGGIIFDDKTENMIKGDSNRAFYAAGWLDNVDLRTSGVSGSGTPSLPSVP